MKQVINAWNGLSKDEQLAVLDKIAMVGGSILAIARITLVKKPETQIAQQGYLFFKGDLIIMNNTEYQELIEKIKANL